MSRCRTAPLLPSEYACECRPSARHSRHRGTLGPRAADGVPLELRSMACGSQRRRARSPPPCSIFHNHLRLDAAAPLFKRQFDFSRFSLSDVFFFSLSMSLSLSPHPFAERSARFSSFFFLALFNSRTRFYFAPVHNGSTVRDGGLATLCPDTQPVFPVLCFEDSTCLQTASKQASKRVSKQPSKHQLSLNARRNSSRSQLLGMIYELSISEDLKHRAPGF